MTERNWPVLLPKIDAELFARSPNLRCYLGLDLTPKQQEKRQDCQIEVAAARTKHVTMPEWRGQVAAFLADACGTTPGIADALAERFGWQMWSNLSGGQSGVPTAHYVTALNVSLRLLLGCPRETQKKVKALVAIGQIYLRKEQASPN